MAKYASNIEPKPYLQWLMEAYFDPKFGRDRMCTIYTQEDHQLSQVEIEEYERRQVQERAKNSDDRKADPQLPIYGFSIDERAEPIAEEQFRKDTKRASNKGKPSLSKRKAQRDSIYYL